MTLAPLCCLFWCFVTASLSNCSTTSQCASLVSAAFSAQFGSVNATLANHAVSANNVLYGPVYERLNQCLEVSCAVPLKSEIVALDTSYRLINETVASLLTQIQAMRLIWTNCTAAAKVNTTINCDLENRLMGRVNEKMEWLLRKELRFYVQLGVQCQGNVACSSYLAQQINSTLSLLVARLEFEDTNVGLFNRVLNCSQQGGDCGVVLGIALGGNFSVSVRQFGSLASVINQTNVYVAFRDLLEVAPLVSDPMMCVSHLRNFSLPILDEYSSCRGLKLCGGQTSFTQMRNVFGHTWVRLRNFSLAMHFVESKWCMSLSCSRTAIDFEERLNLATRATEDLYFNFLSSNPTVVTVKMVVVGMVISGLICIAGLVLLICGLLWDVTSQQLYIILVVFVVCGNVIHLVHWAYHLLFILSFFGPNRSEVGASLSILGHLNRMSQLTIMLAIGLFCYEFFRGVYIEVLHRKAVHVKVVKWILLVGAVLVFVFTVIAIVVFLVDPSNLVIGQVNEKIILGISVAFSVFLFLLAVSVVKHEGMDKKSKYLVGAWRMLVVSIIICVCMIIQIVLYTYDVFSSVYLSKWVYFGLLRYSTDPIVKSLLLAFVFTRFLGFRARQAMSKRTSELSEPLMSDGESHVFGDRPIPPRYADV